MHSSTRSVAAAAAVVVGFLFTSTATARPPVSIRTGSNLATDGYLEIQPDEYGSWAANFTGAPFGPNADRYKPAGSPLNTPSFTSGFFLFAPGGQRELLSDNTNWQATTNGTAGAPPFSADTSLSRAVTAPNVASDSNGDGINDTLNSSFRVFSPAPGTDLGFQLNQRVASGPGAVSFMQQNYTVTNNGTAPITIGMVRAFDGDLLWDNNFETDSVGTGANGGAQGPYVFMQEPTNAAQSVTLSIPTGSSYYGGKHGVDPDGVGGSPAYDFGSDTEVWDANGVPTGWRNHIAGVGYNTNGQSGPAPTGSTTPRDAFLGMDLSLTLAPGASQSFTVFHTYGSTSPIPEPATLSLMAASAALLLRRRRGA
jgi:hypothetical protein